MPPLVGEAVNVTVEPAQIEVAVEPILTAGVILPFTVIVMVLLLAEAVLKQAVLEVSVQLKKSPSAILLAV